MSRVNESVGTLSKFQICREIFGGKFRPGENVDDISDISDISVIYSMTLGLRECDRWMEEVDLWEQVESDSRTY
jgi:hypothetical protein